MTRIPNSRSDFHNMTRGTMVRIYRAARAHAVAREQADGLTPQAFDEDIAFRSSQLIEIGWRKDAAMTSVALGDYLSAHATINRHESPETKEWSNMEATFFVTTERYADAYRAIFAA